MFLLSHMFFYWGLPPYISQSDPLLLVALLLFLGLVSLPFCQIFLHWNHDLLFSIVFNVSLLGPSHIFQNQQILAFLWTLSIVAFLCSSVTDWLLSICVVFLYIPLCISHCIVFFSVSLLRPSHWSCSIVAFLVFLGTLCCRLLTFPLCCAALMTI